MEGLLVQPEGSSTAFPLHYLVLLCASNSSWVCVLVEDFFVPNERILLRFSHQICILIFNFVYIAEREPLPVNQESSHRFLVSRFTSIRVSAKYHGIKLEYRELRHTALDLLGQIRSKLQVWKRPSTTPEAVQVLLQEWHVSVPLVLTLVFMAPCLTLLLDAGAREHAATPVCVGINPSETEAGL